MTRNVNNVRVRLLYDLRTSALEQRNPVNRIRFIKRSMRAFGAINERFGPARPAVRQDMMRMRLHLASQIVGPRWSVLFGEVGLAWRYLLHFLLVANDPGLWADQPVLRRWVELALSATDQLDRIMFERDASADALGIDLMESEDERFGRVPTQ